MNDLFNKFQDTRKTGTRKGYTMGEQVALIILGGEKKTPAQIAEALGRTVHSVNYKLSGRGVGACKNITELAAKNKVDLTPENVEKWEAEGRDLAAKVR